MSVDFSREKIGQWRNKFKQTLTGSLKNLLPEPRRQQLFGRNRQDGGVIADGAPRQPRGTAPAPPTDQAPAPPSAITPTRKSNTPTKSKSETQQPSPRNDQRNSPHEAGSSSSAGIFPPSNGRRLPQTAAVRPPDTSTTPLLADVGNLADQSRNSIDTVSPFAVNFGIGANSIAPDLGPDFVIPKPRDMPPHDDIYHPIVPVPEQVEIDHTRHRSHPDLPRQMPPHHRSQSADFEVTDCPEEFPVVCVDVPTRRHGTYSHSIEQRARSDNDKDLMRSRVVRSDLQRTSRHVQEMKQPPLGRSHSVFAHEARRNHHHHPNGFGSVGLADTSNANSPNPPLREARDEPGKRRVKYILKGESFLLYEYYKPTRILGYGAYAVVCEALDTRTNQVVAIKKNKRIFADIKDAKRMFREIKLLLHFKHDDMVRLIDVIPPDARDRDTFDDIYLVTNRMQTNLKRVIQSKSLDYGSTHIKFFIYQILRGLKYIHSAGVVHRDLKPENILVDENCKIRISDFGLARGIAKDDEPQTEYVITRWYRAPEVMLCSGEYDELVDVWSVGCIFAEIFLRTPLFPGANHVQQMQIILMVLGKPVDTSWIKSDEARQWIDGMPPSQSRDIHQLFPTASEPAIDLLQRMLRINPAERITVEEGLRHPYVDELHHEKSEVTCHELFVLGDDFERAINSEFGIRHMMFETLKEAEKNREERRARRKNRRERRKDRKSKPRPRKPKPASTT